MDGALPGRGDHAHRHSQPQGRLQSGLRLLHRDHAHPRSTRFPADYQRKQTLKNAERYITPELKEYEEKVLTAQEKIHQREYELFLGCAIGSAAQTQRLLQTAEVLATLDVLASLAELAAQRELLPAGLVRRAGAGHRRTAGIRSSIRSLPPGTFVPNDVALGPDDGLRLAHHRAEHGRQIAFTFARWPC